MASREKRKPDKKSGKRVNENVNANKSGIQEPSIDEVPSNAEVSFVEEVVEIKEPTSEQIYYEEPVLTELIVARYEGQKVKGLYEGEGEAYFIDGHCYKGTFSEGYMHGKGIYMWADGIVYEGDFLKNQITGKGKYTWPDGNTYVGDVLNGKRHGYGIFHNADSSLSYAGEWYFGSRHGKGRMNYDGDGRSYYEGSWENGMKHGWGSRQYPSGNTYHGMWFNNVRHGEGTMKWLDKDQVYIGQWENGIQHGIGQHVWLLRRVLKSQYSMRNMYCGELVHGKRHGEGIFYYANGAKYEGQWKDNFKSGKGKFTFKNGRIYEGMFENDHIVEFPDFYIDGVNSPDMSKIRTRTPVPADNVSIHSNESRNTVSPSFQLDINTLLVTLPPDDLEREVNQVLHAITRYVSTLHRIYTFYSSLGYQESPDNTFIMNKMQFWVFLKDIHVHHGSYTLTDMDRVIGANYQKPAYELHNPYEKILQRQFINYLIILSHLLYSKDYHEKKETGPLLEYCFSRLMTEKVLCHACRVQSPIYAETRRAINVLVHMDQTYAIYQTVSTQRKHPPKEPVVKMRQLLFLLKDLQLINEDLTPEVIVQVLQSVNPTLSDGEGSCNLELEMTFLEFFETLIGCAERYVTEKLVIDPTTPCTSLGISREQSMHSIMTSPFHIPSQIPEDEAESSQMNIASPGRQLLSNVPSSSVVLSKVLTDEEKAEDSFLKQDTSKTGEAISRKQSVNNRESTSLRQSLVTTSRTQGLSFLATATQSKNLVQESLANLQNTVSHLSGMGQQNLQEFSEESQANLSVPQILDEIEEDKESVIEVAAQEDVILLVDDETRKFNFWTHQIHIFFVSKFFPHMERHMKIQKLMDAWKLEKAREKLIMASEAEVSEHNSEIMESNIDMPEGDENIEEMEQLLENVQL